MRIDILDLLDSNVAPDELPENLYKKFLNSVEMDLLYKVMIYTGGNQSQAARILGMNRGTLRKKSKLYNIMWPYSKEGLESKKRGVTVKTIEELREITLKKQKEDFEEAEKKSKELAESLYTRKREEIEKAAQKGLESVRIDYSRTGSIVAERLKGDGFIVENRVYNILNCENEYVIEWLLPPEDKNKDKNKEKSKTKKPWWQIFI